MANSLSLPLSSSVLLLVSKLKQKKYGAHKMKLQMQLQFIDNIKGRMHGKNGHFQVYALENKDKSIDAIQEGQDLEALKRNVIQAVANTNRGKDAIPEKKQRILKLVEVLEACNPTANPTDSPFLSGLWSLLYTAPTYEKADKYAGAEEGPFLARFKPISFGTIRQTASFQVIDTAGGSVQNIADFTFFGIKGKLVIKGIASKSSTVGKESMRLDVNFESFFLRISNWQSPTIPLDWINPKGWVDTTFLDQDLRVGRGDKGSIFVSSRVKKQ